MKIAVVETKGWMGQAVSTTIDAVKNMGLVTGLDARDDLEVVLGATGATHAVDFTNPGMILSSIITPPWVGVHVVVSTSGWIKGGYR